MTHRPGVREEEDCPSLSALQEYLSRLRQNPDFSRREMREEFLRSTDIEKEFSEKEWQDAWAYVGNFWSYHAKQSNLSGTVVHRYSCVFGSVKNKNRSHINPNAKYHTSKRKADFKNCPAVLKIYRPTNAEGKVRIHILKNHTPDCTLEAFDRNKPPKFVRDKVIETHRLFPDIPRTLLRRALLEAPGAPFRFVNKSTFSDWVPAVALPSKKRKLVAGDQDLVFVQYNWPAKSNAPGGAANSVGGSRGDIACPYISGDGGGGGGGGGSGGVPGSHACRTLSDDARARFLADAEDQLSAFVASARQVLPRLAAQVDAGTHTLAQAVAERDMLFAALNRVLVDLSPAPHAD